MLYNQPFDQPLVPNAPYVNGNPSTGVAGSIPPAAALEYPQRELVNLIGDAGLTPSNGDLHQTTRAVRGGQLDFAADTGTADALIAVVSLAHTALKAGLPFTVLKGNAPNATASPRLTITDAGNATPITGTIVKSTGAALAPGDLPAGAMLTVRADGTSFRLVSILLASDVVALTAAAPIAKSIASEAVAGTYSFTVPAGIFWIYSYVVGAGGGAPGQTPSATRSSGGGGSGGTAAGWIAVKPGQVITYVVGAGGPGAPYGGSAGGGATSSFGSFMQATGGGAGLNTAGNCGGGAPGVGSGGQINIYGAIGGDGNGLRSDGQTIQGGAGGASSRGGGGRTSTAGGAIMNGFAPGSGGGGGWGGAGTFNGGTGADGSIDIFY